MTPQAAPKLWDRAALVGEAREFCTDAKLYDECYREHACASCLLLQPSVRITHVCEHPLCEACAAAWVAAGKTCHCSEPIGAWVSPSSTSVPSAASLASQSTPSSSSSSSSFSSSSSLSSAPASTAPRPAEVKTFTKSSRRIDSAMSALRFRCVRDSCDEAKLKFDEWLTHCATRACRMLPIVCTHCKRSVLASHETKHAADECEYRPMTCPHCKSPTQIPFIGLSRHWRDDCANAVLNCDNTGCTQCVMRADMSEHRRGCEWAIVACELQHFGCKYTGPRRSIDAHMTDDNVQHTRLFLKSYAVMERQVALLTAQVLGKTRLDSARTGTDDGGDTALPLTLASSSSSSSSVHDRKTSPKLSVPPSLSSPPPPHVIAPDADLWARLDAVLAHRIDIMPPVLVADEYGDWFVAKIRARGDPNSGYATVGFPGFVRPGSEAEYCEAVDLASGRVRPLVTTPSDYVKFFDLKSGDLVDYRVTHPVTRKDATRHEWKHGAVLSVASGTVLIRVDSGTIDTVDHVPSRFAPSGTVCGLVPFDAILFPRRPTS